MKELSPAALEAIASAGMGAAPGQLPQLLDPVTASITGDFRGYDFTIRIPYTRTLWHFRDNEDGTWSVGCEQELEELFDLNHELEIGRAHV